MGSYPGFMGGIVLTCIGEIYGRTFIFLYKYEGLALLLKQDHKELQNIEVARNQNRKILDILESTTTTISAYICIRITAISTFAGSIARNIGVVGRRNEHERGSSEWKTEGL